jgi:hypothetical protein
MLVSKSIYFILLGILLTVSIDFYFSASQWTLTLFAASRAIGICIALVQRIVYDSHSSFATIEQAIILYQHAGSIDSFRSMLLLIEQVSIPLLVYLWIRRIERTDMTNLQKIWREMVGTVCDQGEWLTSRSLVQ